MAETVLGLQATIATVGEPVLDGADDVDDGSISLKLNIIGAKGLRNADVVGCSDPYCVCEIPGKPHLKFKTPVVSDTCDPIWEHSVEADIEPGDGLEFSIYDSDVTGHELLGTASLTSAEFYPGGFNGSLELDNTGLKVGTAALSINIELPSPETWIAWPPTIEGLTQRLMQTRARLVSAEKRAGGGPTGTSSMTANNSAKSNQTKSGGWFGSRKASERIDPEDEEILTYKQLKAKYKGQSTKDELKQYWENSCIPVDEAAEGVSQKLVSTGRHFAAPPCLHEPQSVPESGSANKDMDMSEGAGPCLEASDLWF